jgi:hypothetical protein
VCQVELEHRISLNKNAFTNYLSDRAQIFKDASFWLAVFINLLMLFTYDSPDIDMYRAPPTQTWNWYPDFDKATVQDSTAAFFTRLAGYIQTCTSCVMVTAHLVTFVPVVVKTRGSASLREWHATLSGVASITADQEPLAVFYCFRAVGLLHIQGHVLLYQDFLAFLDPYNKYLQIIYWKELNPNRRPAWLQYAICLFGTANTDGPVLKLRFSFFNSELLANMRVLYDFHHPRAVPSTAGGSVDGGNAEDEHDEPRDVEAVDAKIDALSATTTNLKATTKAPKILRPSFVRTCAQVSLYALQTPRLFYYTVYLVFSFLGNLMHPFFFCFHLLDLVARSRLLQQVLRAVTENARSLTLTFGT